MIRLSHVGLAYEAFAPVGVWSTAANAVRLIESTARKCERRLLRITLNCIQSDARPTKHQRLIRRVPNGVVIELDQVLAELFERRFVDVHHVSALIVLDRQVLASFR